MRYDLNKIVGVILLINAVARYVTWKTMNFYLKCALVNSL